MKVDDYQLIFEDFVNNQIFLNPLFLELKSIDNSRESIYWSLKSKISHTLVALKYFQTILSEQSSQNLSTSTIVAITILELTQVDFADSLGERKELKNYPSQLKLYKNLKDNLLYNKSETLIATENYTPTNIREVELLERFINELNNIFFDIFRKQKNWKICRNLLDKRIEQYYKFIIFVHLKQDSPIKQWFIKTTSKDNNFYKFAKDQNSDIWLSTYGDSISFLSLIFILCEFHYFEDFGKFQDSLIKAFTGVGMLNVLLDSIVDVEEDESMKHKNLYSIIKQNGYENYFNLGRIDADIYDFFQNLLYNIHDEFINNAPNEHIDLFYSFYRVIVDMTEFYTDMIVERNRQEVLFKFLKIAQQYYRQSKFSRSTHY